MIEQFLFGGQPALFEGEPSVVVIFPSRAWIITRDRLVVTNIWDQIEPAKISEIPQEIFTRAWRLVDSRRVIQEFLYA
jgi:hypothetical protein